MKHLYICLVAIALCSCAENGELGFNHHPMDCAEGFAHSDCLPGTLGYAVYNGNTNAMAIVQQNRAQQQYNAEQTREMNNQIFLSTINANRSKPVYNTSCYQQSGNTYCTTR